MARADISAISRQKANLLEKAQKTQPSTPWRTDVSSVPKHPWRKRLP